MTTLNTQTSVDNNNYPMFSVVVNDGGPDGGSSSVYNISVGMPGSVSPINLETAVQSFANSLSSPNGFTITSVTKITVNETSL